MSCAEAQHSTFLGHTSTCDHFGTMASTPLSARPSRTTGETPALLLRLLPSPTSLPCLAPKFMPETARELYTASCNPSRRAKRDSISTLVDTPAIPSQPRPILPMKPYAPRQTTTLVDPPPVPAPAKRGRKPGPLSRTAREAQRRLNHSIIEKARRTKINDALATLKQLVPPDYGQKKKPEEHAEDDEDDEDDDDYTGGAKKKLKPKGKKEEKEKEFKLEILVRTVSFLQDLLQRVEVLEAGSGAPPVCPNCSNGTKDPKKRKRADENDEDVVVVGEERTAKFPRISSKPSSPPDAASTLPSPHLQAAAAQPDARLPSISSWLPNSAIDPQLLPQANLNPSPRLNSYLPSPPSSTHFDPVRSSQIPPVLSLGPVATAAMMPKRPKSLRAPSSTPSPTLNASATSSAARTPEDESAASLLLQIATSPSFRPVAMGSTAYALPDPTNFSLHSDMRSQRDAQQAVRQAQTPGSILGLTPDRLKRPF
ncbi:unnamed protein product [Cyclocybe aegerita]|uniref:BHLH domain-containing protein n=1 Tax=Cyclocybe aegerita TaxID=1973307 RepID=A0A8S0XQM7_CYCAE|nr:unnamed protein product [Cyclocybe aegerita]